MSVVTASVVGTALEVLGEDPRSSLEVIVAARIISIGLLGTRGAYMVLELGTIWNKQTYKYPLQSSNHQTKIVK